MWAKAAFPITRMATNRPARATRSLRASASPDFSTCSNSASASAHLCVPSTRLWYGSMPWEGSVCSFWRRCSSCRGPSPSIPRKSKGSWRLTRLEHVEGAAFHWSVGTEWIVGRPELAGDCVNGPTAAADAAHDAVTAVTGVDGEARDACWSQEWPSIGRVGVLAGLQPPLQPRGRPHVVPEGDDARQRMIAGWIEKAEGKRRGRRYVVERRLGGGRGPPRPVPPHGGGRLGGGRRRPERVRSSAGGSPVRPGFEVDRHRRVRGHRRHIRQDEFLSAHGREQQVEAGELADRTRKGTCGDYDGFGLDVSVGRGHAAQAVAMDAEPGHRDARTDSGAARPGKS